MQKSASLADAYLKTVRARKHLDTLGEELDAFRQTKPHRFHTERDLKAGKYRLHFSIAKVPDPVWLMFGDFLACMRASLDHLVWSLAVTKDRYPRNTEFPILEAPNGRFIRSCTKGVPADARKIIVDLQPYQGGNIDAVRSHFLWRLNKLCNIDKHRRIPVHGDVSHLTFPEFPKKFGRLIELDHDNGVISVPLELERYMTLNPDTAFNVIFGDPVEAVTIDLDGIERLYQFVTNDVLPRFARFFK